MGAVKDYSTVLNNQDHTQDTRLDYILFFVSASSEDTFLMEGFLFKKQNKLQIG